jgi:hypothetical protein
VDGLTIMYRVVAVVGAALVLAACSSDSDVFKSGFFHSEPVLETVRFESEPPGAEAKTSIGQSCRTPCALALPGDKPFDVTFTLAGYQPDVEKVERFAVGDGTTKLRPNPVLAELTPMAPPKKVRKRRVTHKRKAVVKRAVKPAPRKPVAHKPTEPKPAAAPTAPPPASPPPAQAPSPWPAPPPAKQ